MEAPRRYILGKKRGFRLCEANFIQTFEHSRLKKKPGSEERSSELTSEFSRYLGTRGGRDVDQHFVCKKLTASGRLPFNHHARHYINLINGLGLCVRAL
jgi:hypothetical protein